MMRSIIWSIINIAGLVSYGHALKHLFKAIGSHSKRHGSDPYKVLFQPPAYIGYVLGLTDFTRLERENYGKFLYSLVISLILFFIGFNIPGRPF